MRLAIYGYSSQNVIKSRTVEYYQDTTDRVSLTTWSISERVSLAGYLKDPPLLSIHHQSDRRDH